MCGMLCPTAVTLFDNYSKATMEYFEAAISSPKCPTRILATLSDTVAQPIPQYRQDTSSVALHQEEMRQRYYLARLPKRNPRRSLWLWTALR